MYLAFGFGCRMRLSLERLHQSLAPGAYRVAWAGAGLLTRVYDGEGQASSVYLLTGSESCRITWSREKLADFCRGGKALKVERNLAT